MDAALELLASPAAGARVQRIEWNGRARLAADAREAGVVERQQRDVALTRVLPDIASGPRRQRVDLRQDSPARQAELFDFRQVRAAGRLLAAQAREPGVVAVERREQWADLVPRAAVGGARLPQPDIRLGRLHVDQVELPPRRDLVAVGERFREVMKGLEE